MMIDPPITELLKKVDCRYTLVMAVAKRARQLLSDTELLAELDKKPVTIAVEELMAGEITISRAANT